MSSAHIYPDGSVGVFEERRKRIKLSLAAYAYENTGIETMTDAEFDKLSLEINPEIRTGKRVLDLFFRTEFDPDTGSWVHYHPEHDKLKALFEKLYKKELEECK